MSTLADAFLDDLDELEENSEEEQHTTEIDEAEASAGVATAESEEEDDEDNLEGLLEKVSAAKGVKGVSHLRRTARFREHIEKIENALKQPVRARIEGTLEDDPEYKLIDTSNAMILEIDEELLLVHRFVADLYGIKFPELESTVPAILEYVRTVKVIGNEMDMTKVDLAAVLPSAQVIAVSVTGNTTTGRPLTDEELATVLEGCDEALALHEDKQKILRFVETRMQLIAPNVSALLGTRVAAQLMGIAGGLTALSKIPGCNVLVLGKQKKQLSGFSRVAQDVHVGLVHTSDIVTACPPNLRRKAAKLVANKVSLAARIDSTGEARGLAGRMFALMAHLLPDGNEGQRMRDEIEFRLAKLQEPPPAKQKKPLKAPDERPRRKRGGKRYRKMKERLGMTDMRKQQNRLAFAQGAGEYGDEVMGFDQGMLGNTASGALRVKKRKNQLANMAEKRLKRSQPQSGLSGIATSLAFTPVQGIELLNPDAAAQRVREANEKYFKETGTFTQIRKS